jgi:RNA polymerase sigma factor (sigma-70 family)
LVGVFLDSNQPGGQMDRNEFRYQYEIIARTVRKSLWHKTKDVHLIDDVCQNVLVICWKKDRELRELPSERFERFVVRVALNLFCSWMRKRKLSEWPEGLDEKSKDEDPALTVEKTEQSIILRLLIDRLPPRYRDITRLHIFEGWTHERIAIEKGVSVNTVKTQFHRAKTLLEKAVNRYFLN